MARGKTKIARIEDERVLKSTFQKRKKGLIKKVKELTTLCDIIACVVIYCPVIGGRPPEICTWPEEQDRVHAAIRMYKEKMDHSRRTADLCNYLKDRRRLEMSDQVGSFYEGRRGDSGMPAEVAVAYLKWVDARIKAVEERIDLVKSCGMMFGNDQCQNVMFDDDMMMMMMAPVMSNQVVQDQNFGYGSLQDWSYQQNPYGDFAQFDLDVYDQTQCGVYNPTYMNSASNALQFQQQQQPIEPNAITCYQQNQNQNQMCLYDPYLLGMEQNNTMSMSIYNGSQYYQQQQLMPYSGNVTEAQPLRSSRMDDMTQLCPYLDEWSSPNASSNYSSSSSNQFNKAALDDQLECFLNATEFADEMQPQGDGAGGTVPSCQYGI